MKMIVASIIDHKSGAVSQALLDAGFRVTKLASTTSILREGTTTLMVGVEDLDLEMALGIIRSQFPDNQEKTDPQATIYVLQVNDFMQIESD